MVDHDVEITHGAEATAELAAGAGEGLGLLIRQHRIEQICGGFEASGGDAGLVDGIFVELEEGRGGERAEGFDELVHVVAQG